MMDVVVLSTADWDHPFWTNKQHVAVALADLGHRVFYIDSLGLRPPSTQARDLRRIFRRLLLACRPPRRVRRGVWVWSPLVIPAARRPEIKRMNKILLQSGLFFWLKFLNYRRDLLWTYNPLCLDFVDLQAFSKSVYHCVDAIEAQPGMPAEQLRRGEDALCKTVDLIFTTSLMLQDRCSVINPNTFYFSNVADHQHFRAALESRTIVPNDLQVIPEPRIGFVGAISPYKLDFALMRELAKGRPDWHFVLIGSIGEGQLGCDSNLLMGMPNIHLLGPRSYQELPGYLKGFDVGIIPAPVNDYTQAMFPMKFFEYLSAGLPVVATRLDSLVGNEAESILCQPVLAEFAAAIDKALSWGCTRQQISSTVEAKNYATRTQDMLKKVVAIQPKS